MTAMTRLYAWLNNQGDRTDIDALVSEAAAKFAEDEEMKQRALRSMLRHEISTWVTRLVKPAGASPRAPVRAGDQMTLGLAILPAIIGVQRMREYVRRESSRVGRVGRFSSILAYVDEAIAAGHEPTDAIATADYLAEVGVPQALIETLAA